MTPSRTWCRLTFPSRRCATGGGHFLLYNVDIALSKYNIMSYGRNGTADPENCGTTTNFNDDIIFSNGTFIQWPEGAQQ
jgi:hypothetical protein